MTPASTPPEWISATLPKIGNRPEENEDAIAAVSDALRFAIADGATEGWESAPWANHLTAAFTRCPPTPTTFKDWLLETRRTWVPRTPPGPIPWYAAAKQEEGSFATLAGLEMRRSRKQPGWGWRAVAVGDSCVLHVHGDVLKAAFPLKSAKEFGNRPNLVPSVARACPEPAWLAGRAMPGDLFLLATDAVAARLFDATAFKQALAAIRDALRTHDSALLLPWLRDAQSAHNDDVSIIGIRLPAHEETP